MNMAIRNVRMNSRVSTPGTLQEITTAQQAKNLITAWKSNLRRQTKPPLPVNISSLSAAERTKLDDHLDALAKQGITHRESEPGELIISIA